MSLGFEKLSDRDFAFIVRLLCGALEKLKKEDLDQNYYDKSFIPIIKSILLNDTINAITNGDKTRIIHIANIVYALYCNSKINYATDIAVDIKENDEFSGLLSNTIADTNINLWNDIRNNKVSNVTALKNYILELLNLLILRHLTNSIIDSIDNIIHYDSTNQSGFILIMLMYSFVTALTVLSLIIAHSFIMPLVSIVTLALLPSIMLSAIAVFGLEKLYHYANSDLNVLDNNKTERYSLSADEIQLLKEKNISPFKVSIALVLIREAMGENDNYHFLSFPGEQKKLVQLIRDIKAGKVDEITSIPNSTRPIQRFSLKSVVGEVKPYLPPVVPHDTPRIYRGPWGHLVF